MHQLYNFVFCASARSAWSFQSEKSAEFKTNVAAGCYPIDETIKMQRGLLLKAVVCGYMIVSCGLYSFKSQLNIFPVI